MKILLTGCTPKQIGPQPEFRYFSYFQALYDALKSRGHDVEWRGVIAGEDLSEYDRAMVGLHVIGSNAARRWKYGAFWAMSQLPNLPILQDWRVRKVVNSIRGKKWFWHSSHLGQAEYDKYFRPAAEKAAFVERPRYIFEGYFPRVLIPLFPWGDPDAFRKVQAADEILVWNPDDWYDPSEWYQISHVEKRERRWTCASLSDVSKWLDGLHFEWPVRKIWPPKASALGGGRDVRWQMTPETDVVRDWYCREWGVLIPRYGGQCPIPGWWRGRYKLAPWCGAVALADEKDGAPRSFWGPDPETLSDGELEELSVLQYNDVMRVSLSREESAERLEKLIEYECEGPMGKMR